MKNASRQYFTVSNEKSNYIKIIIKTIFVIKYDLCQYLSMDWLKFSRFSGVRRGRSFSTRETWKPIRDDMENQGDELTNTKLSKKHASE